MKTNRLLVAAVLAIAIGAPIAGFLDEGNVAQRTDISRGTGALPPLASHPHGIDVDEQGDGTVTEQRLYQLIRHPKPIAARQFEIEFLSLGVEAFPFTFGWSAAEI